jgi:hypothetical protein
MSSVASSSGNKCTYTSKVVRTFACPIRPDSFAGLIPTATHKLAYVCRSAWNFDVSGSYGGALVIKSYYVPSGYVAVVATGGPNDSGNPVGFREHVNPAYQGLRHIPGRGPYPIQESFFARGFGVGVRHRSAAAIAQIKSSGSYTAPAAGVIPV